MVNLSAHDVESMFTMRNGLSRNTGRETMFLIEEKMSANGERYGEIYMRPDGLFEGRIYRLEAARDDPQVGRGEAINVCGVTETLPRAQAIVYEELGF
jgi:hypothetical protein